MEKRIEQLEAELEALREELRAAREKQQAGDESFRRFSDSGILGIAVFELSGKLLLANDALLRMTACRAEDVAAGTLQWHQFTPPEWMDRTTAALEELKRNGSCAPYESEYLRCDRTRFWGQFTGVLINDQNVAAFLLDVTERKKADETLRFQASLLDAVEQAVIASDRKGIITYWNRFAGRLYGWSAEEVIGRSVLEVTPTAGSREEAAAILSRLQDGESWSGEFLVRRKDGSDFPAWITDSPIHDRAGALVGFVGVSSDVTARNQTEEALRTVEQKLTLLTEATGALLTSLNLDRVLAAILALSRRLVIADAYAVWRLDQTTGRWQIAVAEGLSDQYQLTVVSALQHDRGMPDAPMVVTDVDQEPMLAGHRLLLRKEGIRSMLVSPLLMHAANSGTLVFYYRQLHQFDDTELKISRALANLAASAMTTAELYEAASQRAEQLVEADRLKDQFLAMLAHELRNPLGAISNAILVIQRSQPGTPTFQRASEIVERQSRHMARLVDQLLDVSRLSHGKIEMRPQQLDLVRLVEDTCKDHRQVLEAVQLSLSVELPDEPLWVQGDPTRLRQTLGNLLQNAAKFTPPGGQVTVRAGRNADARTAKVEVTDTGIGIPPELLPRLFDPFVQADRSLDRTRGGLGLGLALVKGNVELHRGRVYANSAGIGCGATFTFELPLHSPPGEGDQPGTSAMIRSDGLCVVIIEDSIDAAETLRDLLELFGHHVEVAHSGPSGLELARKVRPDVVLCDLGLPGMDGYAVAAALRQDPASASARLIAVTGYGQEEDIRRSAEAGFHAHLTKPIELDALRQMLE